MTMFGSKIIAVLLLLISWSSYGQHPPSELIREGAEQAEKVASNVWDELFSSASSEWKEHIARRTAAALVETPHNYILLGSGTSTAKGFHDLVDASFGKIRTSVNPNAPEVSSALIFSELQASNQKRWFWARQQLTLTGDVVEVKPSMGESGDVTASIPGLRSFYTQAIQKIHFTITPEMRRAIDLAFQKDH